MKARSFALSTHIPPNRLAASSRRHRGSADPWQAGNRHHEDNRDGLPSEPKADAEVDRTGVLIWTRNIAMVVRGRGRSRQRNGCSWATPNAFLQGFRAVLQPGLMFLT